VKGKGADTRKIFRAAEKRGINVRKWPGSKDDDPVWCPEWTLGGCMEENCNFAHDNAKTPVEYIDWLINEVTPGVEKLAANPKEWVPPPLDGQPARGRRE
jgi:hypothetical protein